MKGGYGPPTPCGQLVSTMIIYDVNMSTNVLAITVISPGNVKCTIN